MKEESLVGIARRIIRAAHEEGRTSLLEPEVYRILRAGGISVPAHYVVSPEGTGDHERLPGERVVVKVVSSGITHKTEVGGVRVVDNSPEEIERVAAEMLESVRSAGGRELLGSVRGFLVSELVKSDPSFGSQVFCGMRFTEGMGHVLAMGFGGLEAEALAASFREGEGMVLLSPELSSPEQATQKVTKSYFGRLMVGATREARRRVAEEEIAKVIGFFRALSREVSNHPDVGFVVTDVEVNPFLVSGGRLVAVDGVLQFSARLHEERSVDVEKVGRLLRPGTAAIMGVSGAKVNIGRVILRNLLREGFSPDSIRVVRPGAGPGEEIDGVACCESLSAMPFDADMLVVAVAAEAVGGVVDEVLATGKAQSLVLIPGGMGETEGGKQHQERVTRALSEARLRGEFAPVMVGPNCLGIRSRPGQYDTLFIPETKLPLPEGGIRDVALVSQSGAFMITRMNRMRMFDPRFAISTGNQLDLTVTDFTEALLEDEALSVLGLYIEGFKPLDGRRLARLVREGRKLGKQLVIYQAGRTTAGRTATSSHTASISGDYASAMAVFSDAGAIIAGTFDEFRAFLTYCGLLGDRPSSGARLGLVSNAGYETVGMADNVDESRFSLAPLTAETRARLRESLASHRLDKLVNPHNPLDLTPMATDKAYEDCVRICLEDETVDALVVGIVPMTVALKTLPPGVDPKGRDSAAAEDALPARMGRLFREASKPIAFVVDGGEIYDPMARLMEDAGLPTFRSADAAVATLQSFLRQR